MPQSKTTGFDPKTILTIDANILADAEGELGYAILEKIAGNYLGFREIRALLWASLRRESPELTIEAAGALITGPSIAAITKGLNKGFADFFGGKS